MRYPNEYQEVPAQFGGDLGIEGFTCSGLVFQCYCPDEDPSGRDLYESQRDKITKDINKLLKNAQQISELGAGIIKEWHFLTPRYNSRYLVSHCRIKEKEVKQKSLAEVDDDFRIFIKTEDDYIPERQVYLGTDGSCVQPSEEPDLDRLEEFLASDNSIVSNIKNKLGRIQQLASSTRAKLTKQLVSGYIVGNGELQMLNNKFPTTYKTVVQLKSAMESQLLIRTIPNLSNQGAILKEILDEYGGKLKDSFSGSLSTSLILILSTEAISDWLGRCPLDFPEVEGTHGGT